MLKVILEVHPTRRQLFNNCCHLECFTQIHSFRQNVTKNNLQFLDLTHHSF
ncbi:hypothetical protein HanIR_Chr10g0451391 [Helianthus annuus]|nr:hypothetical protein HanIR_Chr10g0451391 [Helianthus annuus]